MTQKNYDTGKLVGQVVPPGKTCLMWKGESIENKGREELIEIIVQLNRLVQTTMQQGAEDLRRISSL